MKKRRKNRSRKIRRTTRARRSTKRTVARRTRQRRLTRRSRRFSARRTTRRKRRVVATTPARRTRKRRRSIRRVSRRSGSRHFSGGISGIRGFVNKDMLMLAGGAVGSAFITNWVLSKYGPTKIVANVRVPRGTDEFVLPGLRIGADGKVNTVMAIAYAVVVPLAAAYALRKVSPPIAKGIALGGLINGISQGVSMVIANKAIASAPAAAAQPKVNAYLTRKQLGVGYGAPSAQAMNTVGASPYQSNNAYPQAAFSN